MTQHAAPPPPPVQPSPQLPKQQLIKLFTTISGVQVAWNTDQRPPLGAKANSERAWLVIGVQSWAPIGVDDMRTQWNAAENRNDEFIVGQRSFTVPLQAYSREPSLLASDLCERVRFRLRTRVARALMVPILALRDFQPVNELPPEQTVVAGLSHIVLRANMDVRMLCVVGANPNDPGGGNWIESAEVETPAIGGPSGNLIP